MVASGGYLRRALTAAGLVAAVIAIYTARLGDAPIYLHHDEVWLALLGHSIASTARDPAGHLLPLYFPVFTNEWFNPVPVYFSALVQTVAPLSEWSARLPTVLVAATNVVLMYVVALRIFKREWLALVAALLLMLTPAHFIHGRLAMDYLYPLPFLLGWLLGLLVFLERPRLRTLAAAATCLGVGFYSYIAAMFMMPLYLCVTFLTLAIARERRPAAYIAAAGGFVLPLLLLVPWLVANPTMLANLIQRYDLYAAAAQGSTHTSTAVAASASVIEHASVYWDFFNPAYLFLSGGSNVMNSTRDTGVFLWPLAVFLTAGLHHAATRRSMTNLLLIAGFLSAPLAASLIAERYAVDRALEVLPFGILLATVGINDFVSSPSALRRVVCVCLLALMPFQFAHFYAGYFANYAPRTSSWFERNVRGGLETIIDRDQSERAPAIYLSSGIRWVDDKWRLYVIKHRREDLLARTRYVDGGALDLRAMPARSLVLSNAGDAFDVALAGDGGFTRIARIDEPDGRASFSIFRKN